MWVRCWFQAEDYFSSLSWRSGSNHIMRTQNGAMIPLSCSKSQTDQEDQTWGNQASAIWIVQTRFSRERCESNRCDHLRKGHKKKLPTWFGFTQASKPRAQQAFGCGIFNMTADSQNQSLQNSKLFSLSSQIQLSNVITKSVSLLLDDTAWLPKRVSGNDVSPHLQKIIYRSSPVQTAVMTQDIRQLGENVVVFT